MTNFSIYPINNNNIFKIYKKQIGCFWTVEEIDFSQDYKDFITLDEDKQHSIKMILAFFSNSDGLVNFNIQNNFLSNPIKEISYTYVFQMFMEQIHNECYSLMIETIVKNKYEKELLFNSIEHIPIIKEISEWGLYYSNNDNITLTEKILVFICFEGIMFSGAFSFIYWLKKYCSNGKMFMSGLIKSNEFISRDEGLHVEFGLEVYNIQNKIDNIPNHIKTRIILECVSLTNKFNKEVLKIKQTGMNDILMKQYIEYMADRIFVNIGLSKYFKSDNPFTFMDTIGMIQKTNFHESRPTEYQKSNISDTILYIDDEF
jgi:ribonucleoside-diphosphate reductase beta chain